MTYPPISCMCLTYGRPQRILEEAVYSFLNQDYPGPKELLILNDFTQQTIVFDHPQVTVVNAAERFRSVGEKRNAAVALCRHDVLAVWDDDDIYLPYRLSFSLSRYDEQRRFFKPTRAFVLNDSVISGPSELRFHSSSMWHRSLFDEVGGYAHIGSGEDADLETRFKQVIGRGMCYGFIQASEIYYLYRWSGTESYHLSLCGRDRADLSGSDKVKEYVLGQLERGIVRPGEIKLQPQWSIDYSQLVKDYVATQAESVETNLDAAD